MEYRVRLLAVLGILLTSFLIGGVATTLLYRSQTQRLENQLYFAIELQASAMAAEITRLTNIAAQITSRTRIRQELERHLRGEISRHELVQFSVPKLADALHSGEGLVGITRLNTAFEPLLDVGMPIPPERWPTDISASQTTLGIPGDGLIVIATPIRNSSQHTVGVDLVMFRDERLRAIMRGFFERFRSVGNIQIAALVGGRVETFYDTGRAHASLTDEALTSELIELVTLGTNPGLHSTTSGNGHTISLFKRAIDRSGWTFLFYTDPAEFLGPARSQAVIAALTVLVLALLGIGLTSRVIKPLVNQVATESRNLQRLLKQNEELLDTVQANEGKLQAVIDNAPAVIYIKDGEGRYLLVNSSYERLVAQPRDQIVGKFDYQLFPEDIAKSTRDTDLEVLSTGRSIAVDERAPHADGMHDYLSTKFPLRDQKGTAYAVCGISTDITERKRIERRLAITQSTVDKASVAIFWADSEGHVLYLNNNAAAALQVTHNMVPELSVARFAPSLDPHTWPAHWATVKRLGSLSYETDYRRMNGERFPVEIHANHLAHDDREIYIAVVHDITARRESQRRLKQSATVFDCTEEAIMITDPEGTVLDVNPAFTAILGYSRDEVIGRKPSLWKSELHDDAFYGQMWQSILETGGWRGEIFNRAKDGSIAPELVTINAVRDEAGAVVSYVAIYTDISQIKETQQKLAHLAHHDALTGLPNRALFNERLKHCLDRALRRDGHVAVIFVDLDNFKHVNDSLGHTSGDQLLKEVARLLTQTLRQDDTVARIGGDEFTILIEEVEDRGQLIAVIDKILAAFDHGFSLSGTTVRVTPSLGISLWPEDGNDASTLMRNADAAMYRAKSLGRNTYQFYTEELTREAFARMSIDTALSHAVARGEFQLAYQPQVDLDSGRIVGMEALARWTNPDLGVIPPDQFIPIAEDSGHILQIGEWIIGEACRQARSWLDEGILVGTLAVNISGVQVRRGNLVEVVQRALQASRLPADRLELELTESFVMGGSKQAIRVLNELRALGVTLAVDDFGTCYSSLSYLKSLPIHLLKIDRSFIRDIPEDPNDMAITNAVIALAKSLKLELVAEGVENETQRQFLLEAGCRFGQGYMFYRPLTAADMQECLRAERANGITA